MNSYTYDALHDMTSVSQTGVTGGASVASKTATFTYDNQRRVTTLNCSDSTGTSYAGTYLYNSDSQLTDLTYTTGSTTTLAGYHWDYDNDGRVSDSYSRSDASGTPTSSYTTWGKATYSYDHDSQLTGTSYSAFANAPTSNTSASYDSNGDRTNHGSPGAANRLLTDGVYDYTYDADGNRIARTQISTGAVTYYEWNNANQLTAVSGYGGDVTYTYDAFGRMVSRSPEGGSTEYYVYDGEDLALVLNNQGSVLERELYGPAVDQVLASETPATPTVNWFLTDNQSTVRDVVQYNSNTGVTSVADHLVYDSFGQITWQSQAANQPRFAYDGMRPDSASGLYYDAARWYDAVNGVFISQDPLGFAAGNTNTSRYCGNSPTNFVDPSGMDDSGGDDGTGGEWEVPPGSGRLPVPSPVFPTGGGSNQTITDPIVIELPPGWTMPPYPLGPTKILPMDCGGTDDTSNTGLTATKDRDNCDGGDPMPVRILYKGSDPNAKGIEDTLNHPAIVLKIWDNGKLVPTVFSWEGGGSSDSTKPKSSKNPKNKNGWNITPLPEYLNDHKDRKIWIYDIPKVSAFKVQDKLNLEMAKIAAGKSGTYGLWHKNCASQIVDLLNSAGADLDIPRHPGGGLFPRDVGTYLDTHKDVYPVVEYPRQTLP